MKTAKIAEITINIIFMNKVQAQPGSTSSSPKVALPINPRKIKMIIKEIQNFKANILPPNSKDCYNSTDKEGYYI